MCEIFGAEEILDHLQGKLPPERERQLQEHLPACAACRAAAEEMLAVSRLSGAPSPEPSPQTDQALLAAIAEEAARRGVRRPAIPVPSPAFWRLRLRAPESGARILVVGLSAAAALLLGIVTYVLVTRPPAAPPGTPPMVREVERPAPPPEPEKPPPPPPETPRPPDAPPRTEPVPPPVEPPPATVPKPPETPAPPPPKPQPPALTTVEPRKAAARFLTLGGKVEVGGAAAAEGDAIQYQDAILCRTGMALLELADGSRVALRADTLATLVQQGDEVRVRLHRGEAACSVTRREDRFVVETPHGTATVKGTVFSVRTGMLSSTITVAEGRVEAKNSRGSQMVALGHQCSMNGGPPSKPQPVDAEKSLSWAFKQGLRSLGAIWIPAASPNAEFHAPMTSGRFYAEGSLTGLPVYSPSRTYTVNGRANGGWVTYAVEITQEGEWYLWGRFYYPGKGGQIRRMNDGTDNDPNSFWVSVDGGDEREFGNLKYDPETKRSFFQRWHWGGDGAIEIGKPAPAPLGRLSKGRHAIRVRERESFEDGELRLAPRLDMLCLTPDRDYVPQDEDARR